MKLYINITTSVYLALIICILFISLMQSVNGAQLLIIIIVQTSPPLTHPSRPPFMKRSGSTFQKLREMRGGSENFC